VCVLLCFEKALTIGVKFGRAADDDEGPDFGCRGFGLTAARAGMSLLPSRVGDAGRCVEAFGLSIKS
jgi:hypothetical protein